MNTNNIQVEENVDFCGFNEEDIDIIDFENNSWTYFDEHEGSIFRIFKHQNEKIVCTCGEDKKVYIWNHNEKNPKNLKILEGHEESIIGGDFSFDGKYIVTGDMSGIVLVHQISIEDDLRILYKEKIQEIEEVTWIITHSTRPFFAFGSEDGSVWVYQFGEKNNICKQVMSGFSHSSTCTNGVFCDNDNQNGIFLTTILTDGTLIKWNCLENKQMYLLKTSKHFKSTLCPWITMMPCQDLLAVGSTVGQLCIVQNLTGKVLQFFDLSKDRQDCSIESLNWFRSSTLNILFVGFVSGEILLFDINNWKIRKILTHDYSVTKLEVINSYPYLFCSFDDGKLIVYDIKTFKQVFEGKGHSLGILDFAVFNNGKKIVTAGDDNVSLVFHLDLP